MTSFKLEETKIRTGFTTPEGYFDAFPQKVETLLADERPVRSLYQRTRLAIYAAAAILVIGLSIPLLSPQPEVANLDDATIENYLAHQSNFGQYELLAVMDDADISALGSEFVIDEKTVEEVLTGQNVEQYIIEQ